MFDIGWIVGLYEGEGNCDASKSRFVLRVSQADPEILYRAQRLFGGSVQRWRISKGALTKGFQFMWVLCGPRARGLALTMYSELSTRRKRKIRAGLLGVSRPLADAEAG